AKLRFHQRYGKPPRTARWKNIDRRSGRRSPAPKSCRWRRPRTCRQFAIVQNGVRFVETVRAAAATRPKSHTEGTSSPKAERSTPAAAAQRAFRRGSQRQPFDRVSYLASFLPKPLLRSNITVASKLRWTT